MICIERGEKMNKNSIAVIGQGFVGGSLATVFSERGLEVYAFDRRENFIADGAHHICPADGAGHTLENFVASYDGYRAANNQNCSIYFVCLPTPMKKDGSADLSIVESVLDKLSMLPNPQNIKRIAVVKSTVSPGSTESWNKKYFLGSLSVVFSPEFLTEANALEDMRNQDRIILGGPRPHINEVRNVFQQAFPNVPIVKTSSTTAEFVKYVTNIHLAVKVSLANEFYQICKALDDKGADIDYDKVIEYATLDKRLGKSHWQVPGPMPADDTGLPAFGWAGSCVTEGTVVDMGGHYLTVEKLYEKAQEAITSSISLLSANANVDAVEKKNIKLVTKRHYCDDVYRFITAEGAVITTTPEHFFPVKRNNEVVLLRANQISVYDSMFMLIDGKIVITAIDHIEIEGYEGNVYNVELETNDTNDDDLFWIANGIVTHNCFIKDLNALCHLAKQLGVDPKVMNGAWQKNLEVRPQRDWERLKGRAVSDGDE